MRGRRRDQATGDLYPLTVDALRAIDAVDYITEYLKDSMNQKTVKDDWRYVSAVIDRLLLYVFFGITLGGTIGILFSAPHVFHTVDQEAELKRLNYLYKTGRQ